MHGDLKEHKYAGYDYWHPATRVHSESTKDQLPAGHVLSRKPLAEKLILDLVEVTPIQMMGIGASLEIGAVQSLIEGLQCHRYVASTLIGDGVFYAEWEPNHSQRTHRYLINIRGEDVYVGYFPYDGRKPRLYGVHHKKQDVVKFLHKTHKSDLQIPELTLLTELNIPNISFVWTGDQRGSETSRDRDRVNISHKQGSFYTRSIYGEFIPFESRILEGETLPQNVYDLPNGTQDIIWAEGKPFKVYPYDCSGYNMNNPKHPWYMFQGAAGYIQLFEGKMFCYPDGSIRFITPEDEDNIFRGYIDLQIVQGDLIAYEVGDCPYHPDNQSQVVQDEYFNIDRHRIEGCKGKAIYEMIHSPLATLYFTEDCILTISHPEHGETKYEALKGEMLALLPGTSQPFEKEAEGRD